MSKVISIAALIGLLATSALAGGKVSYPDGSPAAGATVKVIKEQAENKVPANDNKPPQDTRERLTLTTDSQGRFTLPDKKFNKAVVQITAPDGKEYAPVVLPVEMFQGNELAVVLQPKR